MILPAKPILLALAAAALPLAASADAIDVIADGAPWQVDNARGPNGTLVLNPDGTGSMAAGFMRFDATWTQDGERTCIKAGPRGARCVTFEARNGAYFGMIDGDVALVLTR